MDFDFVTARVATGGELSGPADLAVLAAAGITHVIACNAGSPDVALFAAAPGVQLLFNPTDDDGQPKPPAWFQASLQFGLQALAQPHARVYSHCAAGINRGPSTAYSILRALGFSAVDAEATIRAARPQVGLAYKADADAAIAALGYD